MINIHIFCKDEDEARKISKALIEEKLAACCNIIKNVESLYVWEGKFCNEKECLAIVKTTRKKAKQCADRIKSIHSYSVPSILQYPTKANKEYQKWANETLL